MDKKVVFGIIAVLVILAIGWFSVTYFDVNAEGEFRAPSVDVDVDADAGNVPEFEVEGPDVEIGTKEVDISVPDVDVEMEEKTVNVPAIGIEKPGEEEDIVDE